MKATSRASLLCFFLLGASLSCIQASQPATEPELKPPVGTLGLPMGTFSVIEGTQHVPVKDDKLQRTFLIDFINGKKLYSPVEIRLQDWAGVDDHLIAGKRYVLHGYENGTWCGSPPLPPGESGDPESDWQTRKQQPPAFGFVPVFIITSIEKEDGVARPDARPVDPKFSLAEPKFEPLDPTPPLGASGLRMGTYMVLSVGKPTKPTKDIVFEIFAIDGKPADHYRTIVVPFAAVPDDNEKMEVHGFEVGEWRGNSSCPPSEKENETSTGGFPPGFTRILVTGVSFMDDFIVTNWDNRLPVEPPKVPAKTSTSANRP